MQNWSTEIKELTKYYQSLTGKVANLEKELERLIKVDDEIGVLVSSRRCLEVIVTDICEKESIKLSKTIPLKGIIDKLNKEEKAPSHIISSMLNLNSISTYGAHPKEFDPRQVRTVLINLTSIIEWYICYKGDMPEKVYEHIDMPETTKISKEESFSKENNSGKKTYSIIAAFTIVVIVLLLVFDVFNFFTKDKLEDVRDSEGIISIAVMPFENLTGDSTINFWQKGISEFLINSLGTSNELVVLSSQAINEILETKGNLETLSVSSSLARDLARKLRASTHITGNFMGSGENMSILVNLINTVNGEVMWSNRVDGGLTTGQYKQVLDSLAGLVRNYLEIKSMEQQANKDFLNAFPNSAEAYKHYIDGLNLIISRQHELALESLLKAIEIDSAFTFAYFTMAWAYERSDDLKNAAICIKKAYEKKNNLPLKYHAWISMWEAYYISKDLSKLRMYCNELEKSNLKSRFVWFDLAATSAYFLKDEQQSLNAYKMVEKLNKEWNDEWKHINYYRFYCYDLLTFNKPEEALVIAEKGLKVYPDNSLMYLYKGSSYIMLGDTIATQKIINKLNEIFQKRKEPQYKLEFWIGRMYLHGKDSLTAEKHFRKSYEINPEYEYNLLNFIEVLIKKDINYEEALMLSEKAIKLYPEALGFYRLKGLALYNLGNYEEALEMLKYADENSYAIIKEKKKDIEKVEQALRTIE